MSKTTVVATSIELTQKQLEHLDGMTSPSGGDITTLIGRFAAGLLAMIVEGALVIPGECAGRIRKALGANATGEQVMRAVEASVSKEDDTVIAQVRLDPTYRPYYEEIARQQDPPKTVQELWQDAIDNAHEKGWIYEHIPPMHRLVFTPEQIELIREITGRQEVTGTDVVEALKTLVETPVRK